MVIRRLLACVLASTLLVSGAASGANQLLVEGIMKDGQGALLSGTFDVTFALYTTETGGTAIYTEAHLGTVVEGGLFQERLGKTTALQATLFAQNANLWLGVKLSGQPELPRTPLETNPFAFRALTAAVANGLECTGCISATQLGSSYAAAATPGGEATSAVIATTATTALGLACTGCVTFESLSAGVLEAENIGYDDTLTALGAATVQGAIEKLKALLDAGGGGTGGSGDVNEGAGVVREYSNQWGLPSYGVATEYIHLLNPSKPKVQLYLYGGQNTGFSSSNNLIITNTYAPNTYWGGVTGTSGQDSIQVSSPSGLNPGDNVLIHQTVGTGGNGTNAGTWELNVVKAVQASSITLAKPLTKSFTTEGSGQGRAQLVKGVSYNQLDILSGGSIYPGKAWDGTSGGIVFVRAQVVSVKSGGTIHANTNGYPGGAGYSGSNGYAYRGGSECDARSTTSGQAANCSGGGGGNFNTCCCGNSFASGGGGNKTAGGAGGGGNSGAGGLAKGDVSAGTLHFGGGGGSNVQNGGSAGGGLVVLGAKNVIIEQGGKVQANGEVGRAGQSCWPGGTGGGAGGTVAIFADVVDNKGTIEALGGTAGAAYNNNGQTGGAGGEGWVYTKSPIAGIVNQSFATGVEIWVDGVNVTPSVGDPNGKGLPHYDATNKRWGATGTDPWSTGPLDVSNVANWTLGEHKVEYKETGGAGGDLKSYVYIIHPFTASKPPPNDTCATPVLLDPNAQPVVISGTTEDTMGKTKAADDNTAAGCGGIGGPDVVYQINLTQRALLNAAITAPFSSKLYVRKGDCTTGEVVYCADKSFTTNPLEAGTYFLVVDSDSPAAKGDFTLAVSTTPALLPSNDTCASAQKLTFSAGGTAVVQGTTLYSLDQTKGLCPAALSGGPDVVFELDAGTGQTLTANITAGFPTIMYVTTSACGSQGVPLSCSATGALTIQGLAGGKYWLIVDGDKEKSWGPFTLNVTLN
ncbi:MAG: hypothetical protein IV100_15195 [Myxococcales bacterium]|nr:hypothetical protein [Myxococcales bacterium]